jgi:prevent-host-death family protein
MAKRISARDARAHFAELTDEVRYTGEPVIVEKQGRPFVAVVSLEDLAKLGHIRPLDADEAQRDYYTSPEPEDEQIVREVKRTRRELYREWYGGD